MVLSRYSNVVLPEGRVVMSIVSASTKVMWAMASRLYSVLVSLVLTTIVFSPKVTVGFSLST